MRKLAPILAASVIGALAVACLAGMVSAWAADGRAMVLPGSANVQISGRGMLRMTISYTLPANKRLNNLSQHLRAQGWRRVALKDFDRQTTTFVRVRLFGLVREIAIVGSQAARRQTAEISLARCIRIGAWVRCP